MASIGKLSVMLALNAQEFNAGLQSALGKITKFAGMIGVALGARSIASGFVSTIRELENVGDAAASAGVGIGEYMAAVGELNAEDTQAATNALNKMGKTLAELATGGKEKAKEFKDLGIKPEDLKAQTTADALRTIARAYVEAEDPVKKLAIAYAAFGKSASEVIPILDKLAAQDGSIGGRFARTSPDDNASAAQAEQLLTRAENWWKGLKSGIVIDTVKAIDSLTPGASDRSFAEWKRMRDEAGAKPGLAAAAEAARQSEERNKALAEASKSMKDMARQMSVHGESEFVKARSQVFATANKLGVRIGAGDDFGRTLDAIGAAEEHDRQQKAAQALGASGFGRLAKTSRLDFGRNVMDRAKPFMENLSATGGFMARGSAEEGSFRAKFEQHQLGVRTTNEQLVRFAQESLRAEQKIEARLAEIGKLFIQQKPPVVLSLGGA